MEIVTGSFPKSEFGRSNATHTSINAQARDPARTRKPRTLCPFHAAVGHETQPESLDTRRCYKRGDPSRDGRRMRMRPAPSLLDTIVQSATVELFHSYGVAVAPMPRRPARPATLPDGHFGSIAFNGQGMSGTLLLFVPTPILGLTKASSLQPLQARDWIRELTNQLMGRIKTRLLQLQVTLHIGLPSALDRRLIEQRQKPSGMQLIYEFRTIRDEITVTLEGNFDESGFKYSGTANPGSEGDVIIF
jgi:hypothetical protein